jgi:hypothetical protein
MLDPDPHKKAYTVFEDPLGCQLVFQAFSVAQLATVHYNFSLEFRSALENAI